MKTNIQHPHKTIVKALPAGGCLTRKYDGQFCPREIGGCLVLGEMVRPKSGAFLTDEDRALIAAHGEFWAAFDVASDFGESIANKPTRYRIAVLHSLAAALASSPIKSVLAEQILDESPESVIARGGEGVCRQDWDAPYGEMLVVKCGDIFTCRVSKMGFTQSVGIVDATTGEDRGAVKLGGGRCGQVRLGSIIRVEGLGLTEAGRIREPRPCREWLVK